MGEFVPQKRSVLILFAAVFLTGCWDTLDFGLDINAGGGDPDADSDADEDPGNTPNGSMDTDGDTDGDSDADTDSDSDSDTDVDADPGLVWTSGDCAHTCVDLPATDSDPLAVCQGGLAQDQWSCPDPDAKICCELGPGTCEGMCSPFGFCTETGGVVDGDPGCLDANRECCRHELISASDGKVLEGDATVHDASDLAALAGHEEVTGDLIIAGTAIDNLDALESLVAVRGDLRLVDNQTLSDITGLANLEWVGERLVVERCPQLEDLEGLESLAAVGLSLIVRNNDGLERVSGADSLSWVGFELVVEENPVLEQMAQWGNTVSFFGTGGNLIVSGNAMLPTCEVQYLREEVQGHGFSGDVCIVDNLEDGCSSVSSGCGS